MGIRKLLAAAVVVLSAALPAYGQSQGVQQSGPVTPGHAGCWTTNGVLQDCGVSTNGYNNTFGITANGGTPWCIQNTKNHTGPYVQLCAGIDASTAHFDVNGYGGAATPSLVFNIGGQSYPFSVASGVPTVPSLVVLRVTSGNIGTVYMTGYATLNDGGQGVWVYNSSATCTDDTGTCVNVTGNIGTGRWLRQTDNYDFQSFWYGASVSASSSTNLTAFNNLVAAAYAAHRNAFTGCGRFTINGTINMPLPAPDRPHAHAFRFYGCGAADAFFDGSVAFGTQIVDTTGPVLQMHSYRDPGESPQFYMDGIRFEANTANATATTPVLQFDVLTQFFWIHNIELLQDGQGDGILCSFCYAGNFDEIKILGFTNGTSAPVTRYGTGFNINTTTGGGILTLQKISSRGFLNGYSIGDSSSNFPLAFRIIQSEAGVDTNGFVINASVRGLVMETNYTEGIDGTVIIDKGNDTRVLNTYINVGYAVGIDGTSSSNFGSIYSGNTLLADNSVTPVTMIAIGTASTNNGPCKSARDNTLIDGGTTANIVGLKISGVDPCISYDGNTFNPSSTWSGSGSKQISNLATTDGPYGFGTTQAIGTLQQFPVVANGTYSIGIDATPLTQADVSGGVLTLRDATKYIMTATAPVTVTSIVIPYVLNGRPIIIRTSNTNTTFTAGASMILNSSGSFNAKGEITFDLEGATTSPVAYERSRTAYP